MPLDPKDRRSLPRLASRARLRTLADARSHGLTRRPRGSGGNGVELSELGQWAQARFFGYNPSQLPPLDRTPTFANLLNDAGVGCERSQYVVSVSAIETTRTGNFVGQPILTRQQVMNAPGAVGLSQLQLLVQWSLGAGRDNQLLLDVGAGFQMSLPATRIQVALVLPNGAINLDGREGQPIPLPPPDPVTGSTDTAWNECLIWATVNRTGTYASIAEWQVTRGLFVPAEAVGLIPIPQGADFVEIFETSNVAAATTFFNFVTDPMPASADVGQLSFLTNRPRSTGRVRIPGTAKAIQSGPANLVAARLFSAIFTMRP